MLKALLCSRLSFIPHHAEKKKLLNTQNKYHGRTMPMERDGIGLRYIFQQKAGIKKTILRFNQSVM